MGQRVFVLTTKLEGKGDNYGPVAVVTDEHVANEWVRENANNDWVPMELDDLSLTGLAAKSKTTFKPMEPQRRTQVQSQEAEQAKKTLEEANRLLENALKRRRVKSHARRAATMPRHQSIKKFYEERAQTIINDFLMEQGDQDPDIYEFLDYLKTNYRANVPEDEYEILTNVLAAKYKAMFGNK